MSRSYDNKVIQTIMVTAVTALIVPMTVMTIMLW
jgi:hypothetical protein